MTTRNMLVKNTFWLGLVEVVSKVIMFGVTVSLVRYLGPRDFGTFNLAFSYVAMFMILGDFGLNTIFARDVAKYRDQSEKYLSNLLGLKLVLSLIIVILLIASLYIFPTSGTKLMILTVLFYNLAQNIGNTFTSIFSAWERMELIFFTRMVYYFGILISALLVINLKGDSLDIVIGYGITTILSILISIQLIKKLNLKIKISFDKLFWRQLLIESIPMMGLAIVGTVYANNDTLIIGRFLGAEQVGFYQSAYKILFAFQSINVINNAISPRINILIHENNTITLNKLLKIIIIFSITGLVPLALIITWFSSQIITIIYGSSYVSASLSMSVLVWSGVVNYFRILTSNLLFARHKQHHIFIAVLIGLVINVLINFLFVPQYGITASAFALLISEVAILIVTILSLKTTSK